MVDMPVEPQKKSETEGYAYRYNHVKNERVGRLNKLRK
jgi:hypothetical protein